MSYPLGWLVCSLIPPRPLRKVPFWPQAWLAHMHLRASALQTDTLQLSSRQLSMQNCSSLHSILMLVQLLLSLRVVHRPGYSGQYYSSDSQCKAWPTLFGAISARTIVPLQLAHLTAGVLAHVLLFPAKSSASK